MGRLVPDDKEANAKAVVLACELLRSTTEYGKIWYQWVQGSSGGQVSPAVLPDDKYKSFEDTIKSIVSDSEALIAALSGSSTGVSSVTFTPNKVEVPMGTNNTTVTYAVSPADATEDIDFSAPAANKDDFTVDKSKKTITVKRNDAAPKYTITVKGATSGKTVGTLPVEFKVAPADVDITSITFTPTALDVPAGTDTGSVTYTIAPDNANEDYEFTIPEANKGDVTVDKTGKKLTINRNDNAATYVISVKGVRSTKEVGTLNVNFQKPASVESVTFDPASIEVPVGTDEATSTYTILSGFSFSK